MLEFGWSQNSDLATTPHGFVPENEVWKVLVAYCQKMKMRPIFASAFH